MSIDGRLPVERVSMQKFLSSSEQSAFAQLELDVAVRLRRVCGHMTPEQFEALVRDICVMKSRWSKDGFGLR